jgi:hypothetical protein
MKAVISDISLIFHSMCNRGETIEELEEMLLDM